MDSFVQNALKRSFGSSAELEQANRFKLQSASGATHRNVDYFKLAAEEFGFDVKKARIVCFGCGGGGTNTITRLTEMGVEGAVTISVNTDAKHLAVAKADKKILIGKELTRGLGAGGYPEIGRKAAEESRNEIKAALEGVDLAFITVGLGGGTGTGSAPVVAEIAKSMGAIVIGVATMPFKIEGARMGKAEEGLARLRAAADTVIVIENDRLLKYAGNLPLQQAFAVADELVASMVKGITETITLPSLVNVDYADVKAIMHSGGVAALGVGESSSSDRALDAVTKALTNPLLDVDYTGATGALIHITGGEDLRLDEVNLIGETVSQYLDPQAQVIWGARIVPEFGSKIQVITIVTGVQSPYILGAVSKERPTTREVDLGLGIDVLR
ncbi:MAG: cell division protein FtsZ [Candidatus Aenigmatarchaeota archaeon]|nr:cell division protein FtsZ [Candidatus Aenigmarchaeota archaeon]MBU5689477.1 cell division protein FtsZ [Candidatus Aenigmarchaeota archaeon]